MRDAVDICGAVDAPNLGAAVDVWWDRDLDTRLQRAGMDRIFGYHLCDWLADTRDVLLDRGMMGDGVADLKAIRASVEGAGYTGPRDFLR
ncbi:TIM barrel protein [Mesorhizobium sp. M0816]|uniref:TIM barrel protein n=1 Tax=Mesorhizobium sp. M0816 TaxID=2957006 RepID=UPI00333A23E8